MSYEEDFVKEDFVDLEVEGYEKGAFKYKPTTAGEENDWLTEYVVLDENNKPKQDFSKLNKFKLSNVVAVPYDRELIKKISGIDKEWKELSKDEKWVVFGKLKGKVFDKILEGIRKIEEGTTEDKETKKG